MIPRVAALTLVLTTACTGDSPGDDSSTSSSPTTVTIPEGTDPILTTGDPTAADTAADTSGPDDTTTPPDSTTTLTTAPSTNATDTTDTTDSTDSTTDPTAGDADPDPDAPPVTEGPWWRPAVSTTWQIQLTGDLVTDIDAELYDVDLFDAPQPTIDALKADGRRVICYFSAGSSEDWRPDFDKLDPAALGEPLDGWPGEKWLDHRHPSVWSVMRGRLDLAVTKNCDGVDPDNMDGWLQTSGFDLSASDQLAYNRWIANQAHLRGLTVGLKNAGDQVPDLVDYFDFELNEQCHEYDECDQLAPFTAAAKPIFNIEYPGDEADAQAAAADICPQALAADLRTLLLPYELDGAWRVSCD